MSGVPPPPPPGAASGSSPAASGSATAGAAAAVDPEALEELRNYVADVAKIALFRGSAELPLLQAALSATKATTALDRFLRGESDAEAVLLIQRVERRDDRDGDSKADSTTTVSYTVDTQVVLEGQADGVLLVKQRPAALDAAAPFSSQVRVITLGNGASLDMFQQLFAVVHRGLNPLFKSFADSQPNARDSRSGVAQVRQSIAQLEVALENFQQQDVVLPDVRFRPDPDLEPALKLIATQHMSIEDAYNQVFVTGVQPAVLARVQATLSKWVATVQSVCKMDRDASTGNAGTEMNFWKSLNDAFNVMMQSRESAELLLTLHVLRANNRLVAGIILEDIGTEELRKNLEKWYSILKDFPLNDIRSAVALPALQEALASAAKPLQRLARNHEERAVKYMEALSREVAAAAVKCVDQTRLMYLAPADFKATSSALSTVFDIWRSAYKSVLNSKAGVRVAPRGPLQALEHRVKKVSEVYHEHRLFHEVLETLIVSATGSHKEVSTTISSTQTLAAISEAYSRFKDVAVLDTSEAGTAGWEAALQEYTERMDKIEAVITTGLNERLGASQNAQEMLRVFLHFKGLLVRPRIKDAVQQFQAKLIESVHEDLQKLQQKFTSQYRYTEAYRVSTVRDLPPVTGKIVWARQISRRIHFYMQRVAAVLGPDWATHADGRRLKDLGDGLLNKLDAKHIFTQWCEDMKRDAMISGPVFHVIEASPALPMLAVKFDEATITMFKERRNMIALQFSVPKSLGTLANQVREAYPHAVSLQASLQMYRASLQQIPTTVTDLVANFVLAFQSLVLSAFAKGDEITWDGNDRLAPYAQNIANAAAILQDKVLGLIQHESALATQLSALKSCNFTPEDLRTVLDNIQKIVDGMSLGGYSNLESWVHALDTRVDAILQDRLQAHLKRWLVEFQSAQDVTQRAHRHRRSKTTVALDSVDDAIIIPTDTMRVTHEVVEVSGVLMLEPPLAASRQTWIEQIHTILAVACDQPVISANRYEGLLSTGNASAIQPRTAISASEPITRLLIEMYDAVEAQLSAVKPVVDRWLQFQAMWDMNDTIIDAVLGNDLAKWESFVLGLTTSLSTLEKDKTATHKDRMITLSLTPVQAPLVRRCQQWVKHALGRLSEHLRLAADDMYQQIRAARADLESATFDESTKGVMRSVSAVQRARQLELRWRKQIADMVTAEASLHRRRFAFPEDWLQISRVEGEWNQFLQQLEKKTEMLQGKRAAIAAQITAERDQQHRAIDAKQAEWTANKPAGGSLSHIEALQVLDKFQIEMQDLAAKWRSLQEAHDAMQLDAAPMADDPLGPALDELASLQSVWRAVGDVWNNLARLKDMSWTAVTAKNLRAELDRLLGDLKQLPAHMHQYAAFESLQSVLKEIKRQQPLIMELKSDALQARHWKLLARELRLPPTDHNQLTLGMILDADLKAHEKNLGEIIRTARGEMGLEEFLREVADHWNARAVEMANFRNRCRVIRGWDEIFAKLDEHLSALSSMKASPYYRVFADEALKWDDKLTKLRLLLDTWIDVQRRWVYLEGIFMGSADIRMQLPDQYQLFGMIDKEFVPLMQKVAQRPLVMEVMNIPNLRQSLERFATLLERVQKALGDYLERQRGTFSRFYFVGDEDLLEILGNSQDPIKVQRHFSKMFAGIASMTLADDQSALTGMASREGEVVPFIAPVALGGSVKLNEWLAAAENAMHSTLATILQRALDSASTLSRASPAEYQEAFLRWVEAHPAQVVVLAVTALWTQSIEGALSSAGGAAPAADQVTKSLELLASCVLRKLSPEARKKFEQLITELVHQRDVSRQLVQSHVVDVADFQWLHHLRYYWAPPAKAGGDRRLEVRMADASFDYGFEYLGIGERLVQTPLTDRCFLTLTQALHFRLGGNPFGPAGTGKTESVKALGAQLGRFVLVFNCDENFDFQAMGRIFVGLCEVGAWGCFDEFNRLEERILSAVSQQILAIQTGLLQQKTSIELIGKRVQLNSNVGIFVTMNPGYAGRSNLPDNLKQLFRPIAMIKPDWELIAQVMLFSQGFQTAEQLAGKVVLLFSLCADQLSSQSHYDFGLRALKSVLNSAGNLKRQQLAESDGASMTAADEEQVLVRSVADTVAPKLVADDLPLFATLLEGVFPGREAGIVEDARLRARIVELCAAQHFIASDNWLAKVLQLYQIQRLCHGVMMVGECGTGKSSAWSILLEAMECLDGVKGDSYVIDPKAISKDELYGSLDPTTLEWTDGVFTAVLRAVLNNVRGEAGRRHWIIFDGDVDPEWAENLNSVLDDNRLLTLPSGERLSIPPNVRIMFEVQNLQHATLATVSRCGMVWFPDGTVSATMVCRHLLAKLVDQYKADDAAGIQAYHDLLVPYFEDGGLVQAGLQAALEQEHIMEPSKMRLLVSLFSLLSRGYDRIAAYNAGHPDFPMPIDHLTSFTARWVVFSILWGFGGSMNHSRRLALCSRIATEATNLMPPGIGLTASAEVCLLDFEVNVDSGEWRRWSDSVPVLDLEPHKVLSTDIVIPTIDTVRHDEVLRGWLADHRPVILCGPPGSGKTMTLTSTLMSLPNFDLASLNFSSATTPGLILKTFEQYCKYTRTPSGVVLAPNADGKWLVVFCDEINLPENDRYGTQRVISFLRQLTERGGFWRAADRTWITLQRIQFVGACNPPTDAGRVVMSQRFLRHTPLLLVDFPSPRSLVQIYGTFNKALLKLHPNLTTFGPDLTNAMTQLYAQNQATFLPDAYPHYIYSPRELSRWVRAMYEAIHPLEGLTLPELVRLWLHEGMRLFHDRLVTPAERKRCIDLIEEVARNNFKGIAPAALEQPVLFTRWLSKQYISVGRDELRRHIVAKLRTFNEEELNVPIVVFDEVLDHVVRIDRVLRQPLGHLLLVGESGAGKTVLSRFVAWMNGLSIFQIKVSRRYTIEAFDDDLRTVLRRAGCNNENICFIFDESNVLSSAFLERMNALLASGDVPGLFEGDDLVQVLAAMKEQAGSGQNGTLLDSEEDLFKKFVKNIQRNLHVVFTMNPASADFDTRAATSPALFNRCVIDWFGDWSEAALAQVAASFTRHMDLSSNDYEAPPRAKEWLTMAVAAAIAGDDDERKIDLDQIGNRRFALQDAVVACLVRIHTTVQATAARLKRRGGRKWYISPRDYLDLLKHFVSLYSSKRQALEDQQRHLNTGLRKIKDTEEQVAVMQAALSQQNQKLQQKVVAADLKLKQMMTDQQDAETKKRECEILSRQLAERDEAIATRRKEVEGELAAAEPALEEAKASVMSIKKNHLDEIRTMAQPPDAVKLTLEAVVTMLGDKTESWTDIRRAINQRDFITMVVNFRTDQLSAKLRKKIKSTILSTEGMNFDTVNRASKACGPLFMWVNSQVNYASILERVQPLREEMSKLEEESSKLQGDLKEQSERISVLEASIAEYKTEYAQLIGDAQGIKQEMSVVAGKVERSTALLQSLNGERMRWESGSSSFTEFMSCMVGDSLLGAAFLTYGGNCDFKQRRMLQHDFRSVLEHLSIKFKTDLSLIESLSKASDRLSWASHGLPADDLCVENAIILTRFNRFPLVIDPAGQAAAFLSSHANSAGRLAQTSFLDANFMKQLESALRFGMTLLVSDVENVDPVLNPILNREFHKTGGRVLVQLGGQDIDLSPSFNLYMITRDPTCAFAPDLSSRVTFVNFTITPSSLQSQCLSQVLKSERPDVDKQRTNVLKLQGEYQARIRELEDALLNKLSGLQGNILDDNAIMESLETLKKQAAEVAQQAASADQTMAKVNAITTAYLPFAVAATRVYFAMEQLADVHFLYQFSLGFFLSMVDHVLSTNRLDTPGSPGGPSPATSVAARTDIISNSLLRTVYTRVSRSLLHEHKLSFAARVAQINLQRLNVDLPEAELDWLLRDVAPPQTRRTGSVEALVSALRLAPAQVAGLNTLLSFPDDVWRQLHSSLQSKSAGWVEFLHHDAPLQAMPVDWLQAVAESPAQHSFHQLVLVRAIRPDRVLAASEAFIASVLPEDISGDALTLGEIVDRESVNTSPLLLCSEPGNDASHRVDRLAADTRKTLNSVAMGSAEGYGAAEKAISAAAKEGSWVLLRNVHLCPAWLVSLEKRLHNLQSNVNFRLFLTSEIHPKLPVSLLRRSRILVQQQPSGVKASLLRSMAGIPEARMNRAPAERGRLYFLLAWFHAIAQERLRYAPVGWTKAYEFSDADQQCALDVIDAWVDHVSKNRTNIDPSKLPWAAIREMLGNSIYGGRVDNEFDSRLMAGLLNHLFVPESFDPRFSLVERWEGDHTTAIMAVPEGTTYAHFHEWIQSLPNSNSPLWLGLPPTAEARLLEQRGAKVLRGWSGLQDQDDELAYDAAPAVEGATGEGQPAVVADSSQPAWMRVLAAGTERWLAELPQHIVSPGGGAGGSRSDPVARCIQREAQVLSGLLARVRQDIIEVARVCKGETKSTNVLRQVMSALAKDVIPSTWKSAYTSSLASVNSWMKDFVHRAAALKSLIEATDSAMKSDGVWLGGLSSPEAFLTATRQAAAQSLEVPLESLCLVVKLDTSGGVGNGAFIARELALEGASWEHAAQQLGLTDQLQVLIPKAVFSWQAREQALVPVSEEVSSLGLPVYLNETRRDLLFTAYVAAPKRIPAATWQQRCVSLIAWVRQAITS